METQNYEYKIYLGNDPKPCITCYYEDMLHICLSAIYGKYNREPNLMVKVIRVSRDTEGCCCDLSNDK